MATIGQTNLNDSPADPRPLKADDLLPWQRTGAQTGVQTATTRDEDIGCLIGCWYAIPAVLLAWALIAAAAVAWKFWF